MSRTPDEFVAFPPELEAMSGMVNCRYGPYRAVSRFDRKYDDGDTALLMIDPGCEVYPIQSFRLLGLNAPEKGTPEGNATRDIVADILVPGRPLCALTSWGHHNFGRDRYGRILAILFLKIDNGERSAFGPQDILCFNRWLVDAGHAKEYIGWDWLHEISEHFYETFPTKYAKG